MLFLRFKIGDDHYVVEATDVIEVVPYARLKKIPHAPPYVAGLMNYRGRTIPVIDVCYIMTDKPCAQRLSTRIVLVNYPITDDRKVCVGMLIESITETTSLDEKDFARSGVNLKDNAYLGGVIVSSKGIVQRVIIERLLPDEAREILLVD